MRAHSERTTTDSDETEGSGRSMFTMRSLALGVAFTAFLGWLSTFAVYGLFSSRIHYGVLPPGTVAMAIAIIAANYLIGRKRPRMALTTGEIVVIVAMTWIGTASLFQLGAIDSMISVMAGPAYFASPENRWNEYFLVHMPSWTGPSNEYGAVRAFFNGLNPGDPIPWGAWLAPLFWWGSFIAATLGVMACVMVIVHEQWHDHEKLTFPMADIPLGLVGPQSKQVRLPEWMKSRAFLIGAGIPFVIIAWNTLNWFSPLFPHIRFSQDDYGVSMFGMPDFYTKVDFFTIGLAYFAPTQVLRGFWIGRLLIGTEIVAGIKFGFADGMNKIDDPWSEWGTATSSWQCAGGLFVFVFWGLWVGREHFKKVFRSAVSSRVDLPDKLRKRYRAAVWFLVLCLFYMGLWFRSTGMTWQVIVLLLPTVVILNLGISKVIVESSLLYAENPVGAQTLIMQAFGTTHLPQLTLTAIGLSYIVFRANAGMMIPQVGLCGRLGDEHAVPRGRLYVALAIAVFVAFVTAIATVIALAYDVGAFNFESLAYRQAHGWVYNSPSLRGAETSFGPDWYRLGFFGAGMALMAAVISIRMRYYNFWLHPVGLTFASTSVAGLMMINIFFAWAAKATLERLGGGRLVNRAKPFFLGLVCGHSLGVAFGLAVDAIWFPGQGHNVSTGW